MWTKSKSYIIPTILIIVSFLVSYIIYGELKIGKSLSDSDLVTHYGLFLGFGLTIYTFVISVLDNIIKRIDSNVDISNKDSIINNVFSSIKHLKQDVFAIFVIFVLQITVMLIEISFIGYSDYILIIKHGLFIYSLIILYDVCAVLFGIAEISLILLKNRKSEQEEK